MLARATTPDALEVLRGLQQVLSGRTDHYRVTYPCHSPTEQRWFVMPLWQPQYLNKAAKLRVLDEPQRLLGGANTAYLVANKTFAASMPPKQREMLSRIELSVKAVTELDYQVNVGGMTARAAARRWISEHSDTVGYWINGEN